MTTLYDVAAIGNAIVDVIAPASDGFLADEGLVKGSMTLIDNDAGGRASIQQPDGRGDGEALSGGSARQYGGRGRQLLGGAGRAYRQDRPRPYWARSSPTTWTPSAPGSPAGGWTMRPRPAAA